MNYESKILQTSDEVFKPVEKITKEKNGMKINFATQRFEKYVELLVLQQNREKR